MESLWSLEQKTIQHNTIHSHLNSEVSSFMSVDLPAPLGPQSTKAGGGSPESPEAEPMLALNTEVWRAPVKRGAFTRSKRAETDF